MKKVFLVISVAALALTACTSESVEYVGSGPEAKQIAFSPVSQPNTRGQYAITTTSFPDDNTMEVKCYQSAPTPAAAYFGKTTFSKGTGTTYWGGNPAQYWPLSAATLNFFAVSGYGLRASEVST